MHTSMHRRYIVDSCPVYGATCHQIKTIPVHEKASTEKKHFCEWSCSQEHKFNFFYSCCASKPGTMPRLWLYWCSGTKQERSLPLEQSDITCFSYFRCYSSDYFPMQKSLKMISRISSAPTLPVIRPRLVRANRTPSAARARSMSRYRWYWARAAKHCCRWALWRAWVRVGALDRGSPHLERKFENKMNQSNQQSSFCALFCIFG